jgi:3'-phosphoadenosine 5'-phosphosulfate sulfotransferase (PAPS reductase)/FAD synthetase
MWFPLREWTDEDVAGYILQNGVPYDTNRYDSDVVSKSDKHMNTDYAHACMACIDRRNAQFVYCPKLDLEVENIHERVLHEEPRFDYCGMRTGLPKVRSVLQSQGELANSQA